jgi:hypothetical protein
LEPQGYVVLLSGPHDERDSAIQALVQASFRVSKRTDSGNLPDEGLAWIRTYATDPLDAAAIAIQFGFTLRAASVPIRPVTRTSVDPVEVELGERLDALFREDGQAL